jgi:abortive infection bacteriophage resistance protein
MAEYDYQNRNVDSFLNILYNEGLTRSKYLTDDEIKEIITTIGIFKFKGYCYAFKSTSHSIDDILMVYFFDKYLTRIIMDMTSTIETKLKTTLVELCYKRLKTLPRNEKNRNNPFFYLIKRNYKRLLDVNGNRLVDGNGRPKEFKINGVTEGNWKSLNFTNVNISESYSHYNLYYKNKYDMSLNLTRYLGREALITTRGDINYPPFHYLVESATLGGIIHFIKYLKIGSFDVLKEVASSFGITPSRNFESYLERLNEVRNRAAHRERMFNRSYRSISRTGHYSFLSTSLNEHKFIDVYLYFFFMLNRLDNYTDIEAFKKEEIERLFRGFKKDYYIRQDSKMLTKRIKTKEFKKIKDFIIRGME